MTRRNQNSRVWMSESHAMWRNYVKQHPQHSRFAPIPNFEVKEGR